MSFGPQVTCKVTTCIHYIQDMCSAGNIDVLYEEEGRMSRKQAHTECKTFYKKRGLANFIGGLDNVNWLGVATEFALPGQQMSPSVTCIVTSCKYWEQGNVCNAQEITVVGIDARECQDTDCSTFDRRIME